MTRLTDKRLTGEGFYEPKSKKERYDILWNCPSFKDIYNRLAEYEDTGLTPDEIMKLKEGTCNG